jgi:hypothetical protein
LDAKELFDQLIRSESQVTRSIFLFGWVFSFALWILARQAKINLNRPHSTCLYQDSSISPLLVQASLEIEYEGLYSFPQIAKTNYPKWSYLAQRKFILPEI